MNNFKSYHYLSEADLRKLEGWTDDLPTRNPELFKRILNNHGADLKHKIEEVNDHHRMRTSNQSHTGRRWVFVERTDRKWLNTGCASIEAYLASSDEETVKDMSKMSRYSMLSNKIKEEE